MHYPETPGINYVGESHAWSSVLSGRIFLEISRLAVRAEKFSMSYFLPSMSKILLAAGLFFLVQGARACVQQEGEWSINFFVVFSVLVVLLAASLGWLGGWIKRRNFPDVDLYPAAFVMALLLALALAGIGAFVVPEFEKFFLPFGFELPSQTKFVFATRNVLWLPVLIVAFIRVFSRNGSCLAMNFLLVSGLEFVALLLVIGALYSPIFRFGSICS